MSATTAVRFRTDDVCPAANAAGDAPVSRAEQAEDSAALLLKALDDALNAMAHPSPDQYLHLVAAQRHCRPHANRGGAGRWAEADAGNAALASDLGAHLAFDILNCARRYATLLSSVGDYGRFIETSGPPGTRKERAVAP